MKRSHDAQAKLKGEKSSRDDREDREMSKRSKLYLVKKKSEALKPRLAYAAGAYPGFRSMKRLGVFLLPLDGMLVHRRSLPRNFVRFPQQFAGTHLYSWVERGTVRVKCLAQEHNTVSPQGSNPDRSIRRRAH